MARIKITRKTTIKRTVRIQQRVQVSCQPISFSAPAPSLSAPPVQKAIGDNTNQLRSIQKSASSMTQRRSIPSGMYGQPVEQLFRALDERRKPEESEANMMYDVFISHASEDKPDFVNPLVEKLQEAGIRVWVDSLEMQWGKSLREQIDNGIKRSKFAILVLSKHFFTKQWPRRELDGILAKESISGSSPLPIWHNITQEELCEFSPTLAGIYAFSSKDYGLDDICKALQLLLEKET